MTRTDKIAVFDLDGTLWRVNSHYELLNHYYKTKFFTSFPYKAFCKFFCKAGDKIRDIFFYKVPDTFIHNINFEFNEKTLNLFYKKISEGYEPVVVSNAPRKIIVADAAKRLGCSYLCAGIGKKLEVLKAYYKWNKLFVCTDNTTDSDLLSVADDYFLILTNKRIEKKFKELGFSNE